MRSFRAPFCLTGSTTLADRAVESAPAWAGSRPTRCTCLDAPLHRHDDAPRHGYDVLAGADERGDVRPMLPYRLSIRGMPARLTVTDHSFVREAPMSKLIQRITPFLWFDSDAEEAAKFYVSIFKNSRIGSTARYDDEGAKAAGRPKGSVMTVAFVLEGRSPSSSTARPRTRSTTSGRSCRPAASKCSADGSRTDSASRGRSFPPS
jgi:3-demethylubiquinone-9 3-methyltransferase